MKVMAIDPGTTTGLVTAEVEPATWRDDLKETMRPYHVKAPSETLAVIAIWKLMIDFEPTHVVMEDFVLLPPKAMKGRQHSSDRRGLAPTRLLLGLDLMLMLEVDEKLDDERQYNLALGDRRSHAHRGLPVDWTRQMPGERSVITDDYLREQGLWRTPKKIEGAVTGDSNHAMDALRHLIVYMRKVTK